MHYELGAPHNLLLVVSGYKDGTSPQHPVKRGLASKPELGVEQLDRTRRNLREAQMPAEGALTQLPPDVYQRAEV
jgi:hypothetical protein